MSRTCHRCNRSIPPERLKAIPDATHCVGCIVAMGDPKMRGRLVFDHKTGGTLEVVSAEQLQKHQAAEASIQDRISRL